MTAAEKCKTAPVEHKSNVWAGLHSKRTIGYITIATRPNTRLVISNATLLFRTESCLENAAFSNLRSCTP